MSRRRCTESLGPPRAELKNYTVAVIVMLVVFGVAVWLVDTGVVAALVGYSGLRG